MRTYCISEKEIKEELKRAKKAIRQANKGMRYPVKFQHYNIFPHDNYMTLQLIYIDGDAVTQCYNIAM